MFKKIILFSLLAVFCLPLPSLAQENAMAEDFVNDEIIEFQDVQMEESESADNIEAEVIEILEEREISREDGSKGIQQNIKLKGLSGEFNGKGFIFYGISDLDVLSSLQYEIGDKVLVNYYKDFDGKDVFYITDYIRRGKLYLLALIFVLLLIAVGGFKGLRALIGLILTFLVIMKFILPRILNGSNPVVITIFGAAFILVLIIYLTEGFNRRSHIAIASILIALLAAGFLSVIFTGLLKLSGMAQEEVMFLIGSADTAINFQGLLLAGIIIGTLGVLDDMAISQATTVQQIKKVNPSLSAKDIFKSAFSVGISHISSMTNTLFLAYAGASLPLLLLFCASRTGSLTFSQALNNEMIATEIMRALIGSIGIVLVLPISTFLAVVFIGE